jgi:hypothetical protein
VADGDDDQGEQQLEGDGGPQGGLPAGGRGRGGELATELLQRDDEPDLTRDHRADRERPVDALEASREGADDEAAQQPQGRQPRVEHGAAQLARLVHARQQAEAVQPASGEHPHGRGEREQCRARAHRARAAGPGEAGRASSATATTSKAPGSSTANASTEAVASFTSYADRPRR